MDPDVASICCLCIMEAHHIRSIPPNGRTRFTVGASTLANQRSALGLHVVVRALSAVQRW